MQMRRFGKICGFFLCILCFLCGCTGKKKELLMDNPGVQVTFFDVGKGDAILIEMKEHTMLIDTGYDDTYETLQNYLEMQKIKTLDYLVITHFDKDHVGGADRILENFEVEEILQPDYQSDAKQYLEYCAMMEKKELQAVPVKKIMQFELDGAEFLIYPPQKKSYKEEDNDFSLVVSMTYGEKSFLFAGDCEEERLEELLSQEEFDLVHDVLKVPHHGKKEDNSKEFLEAVAPQMAVITCSEEEPASDKICTILEKLKTEIYMTSDGTVTCLCDGNTVQFNILEF